MIDFHCHLDLYPDPKGMLRDCASHGMELLSVTTTPSAWSGTIALARNRPRIATALGLHPQLAHERKGELPLFDQLLPKVQYVGEVGLDGAPEFRHSWSDQSTVFAHVLEACRRVGGRILSIHSRRAATPVLDAVASCASAGVPVLHWFSGTPRELARAVDLGCWFSVGLPMLSTAKGRGLVQSIPRDRLVTESDGPFARVASRPAVPWDVARAVQGLASIWNQPLPGVQEQLLANLDRLRRGGAPQPS